MKVFVSDRMDSRKVYSDQYSTTNCGSTGNNCHVANRCEHDETRLSTNVTSNGDAETKQPLRGDADLPDVEVHPNNNEADVEETEQDMGNLFLLLALCFHTVFEGLAFGLLRKRSDAISLFIAVTIHKALISFSMGTRFAASSMRFRTCALFMLLFAAMCPLGGAIGLAIREGNLDELTSLTVDVVLEAIATGTFIQVVFFEILRQELSHNCDVSKVFATLAGFLVMAVVTKFLPA